MTPTVWVVERDGTARRYPTPALMNQVGFANRLVGWMVSATGTLYVTRNGGRAWTVSVVKMSRALSWSLSGGLGTESR